MQIQIVGKQVEVTQPIHDYVTAKLERITRHFEHLTDVHVVLTVEKLKHHAEATLRTAQQKSLHAEADGQDLYAAIDVLADRLDQQVRKHKEKLTDHHRSESQKRSPL
jgi:putative sigma-54 modulation protein